MSPTCTWVSGTSASLPSASMRRAVFGASPSSDLIAAEVCERALSSRICPSKRERDDHCRGFEVDADAPVRHEARREHSRRDRGDHAVDERGGRAQADQRPHVRAAMDDRLHAAHEERPAGPQHDRRRQRELDPALRRHVHPAESMAEHRQHGHDDRQRQRPPEAAPEIAQLRILLVLTSSASAARAPCRTSDSRPDDPAGSPDASGRCRSRKKRLAVGG